MNAISVHESLIGSELFSTAAGSLQPALLELLEFGITAELETEAFGNKDSSSHR